MNEAKTMSHTPNERARIQARSGLAQDTIRAIERGSNVREASRLRYERACLEEGISPITKVLV